MNEDIFPEQVVPNSCKDQPSPLDWNFGELLGSLTEQEKKIFPKELLSIFNQGADPDTQNSCTRQGLSNITNGNNLIGQNEQDPLLGKKKWLEAVAKLPNIKEDGDYLQNALKQFIEDKLIAGYSVIKTIEDAKAAIDRGNFIYSGSTNGDWSSVARDKIYKLRTDGKIVGHAFVLGISYDDEGMIGINSYGNSNGFFKFPWSLFNTTFTKYTISDFVDEKEILLYKNKLMEERIDRLIALGITNGKDRELNITRGEMMIMLGKLVELIENKTKLN